MARRHRQKSKIFFQSTKVLIYESVKQSMNQSYNYRIYYEINVSNITLVSLFLNHQTIIYEVSVKVLTNESIKQLMNQS